ncbi:multisubunit potassium/proton antiporter, PhaD subunit [Halopseudomonas litoralis]|uniref:Multisubunit potassium/proton antiporter, PhaD subunit n=1 Tax=Halopseudomonas litoralis TaxID=797277 RepID=A0A1H1URF6_9GAMM|nr:monovalent cation/H+ antiporter subunit D [Halopseudomonas litoralis]SDS75102.1 multisubunit potassium/proton antiporter, PhaD subunit [Halopseudomonas litoralis]
MSFWGDQLILLPILLPLLFAAALVLLSGRQQQLKFAINLIGTGALLVTAITLFWFADNEVWPNGVGVYLAGNWVAPFGISLVVDRLSALMLTLSAVIATAALVFSYRRWSRAGVHFHSLFQFLLAGINGSFITGDLFNLFVFFEIMLAASYGLLLLGLQPNRVRASMQYVVVNLVASSFFLIGVALIYASAGTLNMADLAVRAAAMGDSERLLLEVGAAVLAIAFLTKSAMWPLGFWLPTTYAAAAPPVAAMLVLMTKVGVYVLLRLWLLVFAEQAETLDAISGNALIIGGLLTLTFGTIGLLGSQELGRMAGFSAIISSGTLLAAIGYGDQKIIAAALFYLVSSTLAVAAFMLLMELVERIRKPSAAILALTMEAFAIDDAPEESAGVIIPAAMAFLGLSFFACALIIAGLPPLSGFIAKFALFHALLNPTGLFTENLYSAGPLAWGMLVLIIASGLAAIISLMRFGVRTFWAAPDAEAPRLQLSEAVPISMLLLLCVIISVAAGPTSSYMERTSAGLHEPQLYIERVLSSPAVPGVVNTAGVEQ